MAPGDIKRRKADHIEVATSDAAHFRDNRTLLSDVHLVHQSLPESRLEDISLATQFLGKTLRAPLMIAGMTGGTPEAKAINASLAQIASDLGIAFGVGSQRAMAIHPEVADTYQVRDVAPDALIIGNLGGVQARDFGAKRVSELAAAIDADALAIHLNPAQELIQEGGDRDFRGVLSALVELSAELSIPLLVKETGCGLSPQAAADLASIGVKAVDVSGAGGTSWVAVEAVRAAPGSAAKYRGTELAEWGIPTAVSVAACAARGFTVVASGGVRSGLDAARAMALGATVSGIAAPVLKAFQRGGESEARQYLSATIDVIRTITLLSGCQRSSDLARAPRHLGATLRSWIDDLGIRQDHPGR